MALDIKTVSFGGYDKNATETYVSELKKKYEDEIAKLKDDATKLSEAVKGLQQMREANMTESKSTIDNLKSVNEQLQNEVEQLKTDIGGCEIYFDKDSYEFEGKPVEAVTNVTLEGTLLTRDIDYTVEYVNNDKPGTAAVKIKGCGGYTGTADASFEITGKDTLLFESNAEHNQCADIGKRAARRL